MLVADAGVFGGVGGGIAPMIDSDEYELLADCCCVLVFCLGVNCCDDDDILD